MAVVVDGDVTVYGAGHRVRKNETTKAVIPTRDEQRGSLQFSGNHVLP